MTKPPPSNTTDAAAVDGDGDSFAISIEPISPGLWKVSDGRNVLTVSAESYAAAASGGRSLLRRLAATT